MPKFATLFGLLLASCTCLQLNADAALEPTATTQTTTTTPSDGRMYDLSKDKVLYCVGYAHLDTQWRWDFCTTIDTYIKDTLEQNFALFEKYPGYVFNFTGSVRYEMMKEYYPELYERLKGYIRDGQWFVSGSSVDEGDVNVPSAEAVIRQVLYGNQFFRNEFGKESVDFMLPDCFGFPACMPSIWAHCGLIGFSTQKLTWGSAMGIPFKIGVWEGLDGRGIISAFDPGPYVGGIEGRVDQNAEWVARVNTNGEKYGVFADYHYYGVGDQGGAPREEDVKNYLASIGNPDGQIQVALVSSDQMYKDITDEQKSNLPRYKGDLLLTEHSAGTLTSQAYMKRWNRKNELLADAAERAAVIAHWLGGTEYPREKLYKSWVRTLANQMHDILPGTSIPRAYTYSWNDEIVASNGFAAVLTDSVGAVALVMDTDGKGIPLIVYNPLAFEREDVVEAEVEFDATVPPFVRVFGPDGTEVPSQILGRKANLLRLLFLAKVPSISFTTYEVRETDSPYSGNTSMAVSERSVENEFYRVTIDHHGDVAGIFDKEVNRELLSAPHQLVFTHERPRQWPAWNMDWADRQRPPLETLGGSWTARIVENGPVRVALELQRSARGSTITQHIRLAAGDAGRRVEFKTEVDWQSASCALRAVFPFSFSNPMATYNWEMGTLQRGNVEPTRYEVPSHHWFDLTDTTGQYGVSILEDSKYGSDKLTDSLLRLTLLYTPGVRGSYRDQHSQDWGRHEMLYAVYGHTGDWRTGSDRQGRRLNQPLIPFQTTNHDGPRGRQISLLRTNSDQVDVRAVKLAEEGDGIVVRLQELWGKAADNLEIEVASDEITAAVEVDGQERALREATVRGGKLITSLTPFSPLSFTLRTRSEPLRNTGLMSTSLSSLPFDTDVVSTDVNRRDGRFDEHGRTFPAEMLPPKVVSEGISFTMGPATDGDKQAVTCRGQTLALPSGDFDHVYLLAAADEDTSGRFSVDGYDHELSIQAWTGFVGQFDDRIWDREFNEVDHYTEGKVVGMKTGFIKRDPIAWFCTHRHHPEKGNEAYQFSYMFKYAIPITPGARTLTLPDNPKIKLLAATLARNPHDGVRPAFPLYDDFTDRPPIEFRYQYPPPIHFDVPARGVVTKDRQSTFEALAMGPPSSSDYAEQSSGNGVRFLVHDPDETCSPHSQSGVTDGVFVRLNNGQVAQNHDDTEHCVWYDNEGKFIADLSQKVAIQRINTYSWHRGNRAPQLFSIWGAASDILPSPDITPGSHAGWDLLAFVDTTSLGQGDIHGSSVSARQGSLGPYRYLLFVIQDTAPGTFFTEIDVHAGE